MEVDSGLMRLDSQDEVLLTREQASMLETCSSLPSTVVTHTRTHLIDPGDLPRWLGWSRADLVDRPFLDFIEPDDRQMSRQALRVPENHVLAMFFNRWTMKSGVSRLLLWVCDHWENGLGAVRVYLADNLPESVKGIVANELRRRADLAGTAYLWHGEAVSPGESALIATTISGMNRRGSELLAALEGVTNGKESRRGIREAVRNAGAYRSSAGWEPVQP